MSSGLRCSTPTTHLGDETRAASEKGGQEEAAEAEEELQENREVEDPLVEAVERAVEEALEMLLRDDGNHDDDDNPDAGNASDQDSITTACRAAAEQSLRDELALADSDYLLLASWYRGYSHQARSFQQGADHTRRCVEDSHQDRGWWLEFKEDSVAGTSITEASTSWSSYSSGRARTTSTAPGEHFDEDSPLGHDCFTSEQYWKNLLVNVFDDYTQRIDLVVACNLLAVALETARKNRRRQSPPSLLWRGWKQQLEENLNAEVWSRLAGNSNSYDNHDDDTYLHVFLLAVPLLGGTSTVTLSGRVRRRSMFAFLTDTWSRYLTNRHHDYYEIQEID